VTTHSAAERAALVQALRAAGPDAPTLCEGWTARDVAAHLVARERRPDTGPGLLVPALAGWTERVRRGIAARPWDTLLEQVADGPPWTSPFALPGVDGAVNLTEHFVHCEDVRRAVPGWAPRDLPAARQAALWSMLASRGRMFVARSAVPVTLLTPEGGRAEVKRGDGGVELTGAPGELVLYLFGRGAHSQVQVEGPAEAVRRFGETRLGL
jgi:uncharacterized protein (TIGR03085 family)